MTESSKKETDESYSFSEDYNKLIAQMNEKIGDPAWLEYAIEQTEQYLDLEPNNIAIYSNLIGLYIAQGDFDSALHSSSLALSFELNFNKRNLRSILNRILYYRFISLVKMGRKAIDDKEPELAKSYAEEAAQIREINSECIKTNLENEPEAVLGLAHYLLKDLENAVNIFYELIQKDPDSFEAYNNWYVAGAELMPQGFSKQAENLFENAEKRTALKNEVGIKTILGEIYENTGRLSEALGKYNEALSIKPYQPANLGYKRVKLLISKQSETRQNTEEILEIVSSLLNDNSRSIEDRFKDTFLALKGLSEINFDDDTEKLLQLYSQISDNETEKSDNQDRQKKILSILTYSSVALALISVIQGEIGSRSLKIQTKKLQNDLIALRRQLRVNPKEYCEVLYQLGALLEKQKHYLNAAEAYRSVLHADENHINSKLGLARVLFKLGQFQKALTLTRSILEKHPSNEEAMRLFEKLRASRRGFFTQT